MSRFNSLKVIDVIRETPDAVSVAFEVPSSLKQDYKYKQGQYLTLKFNINGEELRRSYSICSSPVEDNELRVAIKKVKDGRVSTFINDKLKVGDQIEVMTPMGNFFTEMNPSNKKNYILFGGGSGITPMLSILKTVLKSEPNSRVTLLYGNNDESSIIFKKQIELLAVENSDRLNVIHVLNTPPAGHPEMLKGMMTKEKNIELVKNYVNLSEDNEFFICGPGPMMENVVNALKELNIPEPKIHIEYFTTPVSADEIKPSEDVVSGAKAKIILDGDEREIVLEENETILEAAIRVGLDAPYACQGGSCCTCRALLQEGEVDMAVNYALSASEVKQGFILTCQSRPKTSNVVVNYDKGL
ncbi:MAG: phenylacetate-CoA oxygenase/reductase, PaaK subunit [Bacteroidota bacterium]|jgi:ring-1,2-phenylacetyl-CoA epoxidase subunit PaaE|nr:phenylacetate-CoA oxygenase/reductase, PaaK subunit [Bacteroidota bacterium]